MTRSEDEDMVVGGIHDVRVHTDQPGRLWLTTVQRPATGSDDLYWSGEMTPTEARALAALLLKHADRAEGKTT